MATPNKPATKPTTTAHNAKPATPAAKPTAAAAPKAPKADSDKPTYADKMRKLPPAKQIAVRLGNEVTRVESVMETISRWPDADGVNMADIRSDIGMALESLRTASTNIARVPDDYKPRVPKGATSRSKGIIDVGTLVRITDKRKEEYAGVLEPAQMIGIKVLEIRGNRLVTITQDGVKALFARGHVCVDTTAATAAAA